MALARLYQFIVEKQSAQSVCEIGRGFEFRRAPGFSEIVRIQDLAGPVDEGVRTLDVVRAGVALEPVDAPVGVDVGRPGLVAEIGRRGVVDDEVGCAARDRIVVMPVRNGLFEIGTERAFQPALAQEISQRLPARNVFRVAFRRRGSSQGQS